MDQWQGKTAIVTGASAGIGAAICEKLVAKGLKVVGLARRVERLQSLSTKWQLSTPGNFQAIYCDVTNESSIIDAFNSTVKLFGPPSILVNNAGILTDTNLIDGDAQKWKKLLDTNVWGLCVATREAVKLMTAHGIDGHIVHINSITGHKHLYVPGINVYGASKHAVTNLTEVLRRELIDRGLKIKITSLSPGFVATELFDRTTEELRKIPVQLALKPEDIADGVVYVLSTPKHVQVHELIIKPVGEVH